MFNLIKNNINYFNTISFWILFIVKESRMYCKKIKLGLIDVLEVVMIKIILILNFVYQILLKILV